MKKLLFLSILMAFSAVYSQVGINTATPHPSSALDIVGINKGVLVPRISNLSSIVQPATGLLVYDLNRKCLSQNTGTPSGPDWICISGNIVKFFYMPSVSVNTSTTGTGTLNLYNLYKNQFSAPRVVSAGAPSQIPFFPSPAELYYYVTDYDTSVFSSVSINASGVMSYNVTAVATACSYINIVFVVK
ncbi:hypothetical protein [Chryseobacterium sp. MEBOG07]|uniref:hypothetical protein n=1 Tax=Chryseobacterium sp. MEBOG07 TaxID=2879939 RepID=UPI001F1DBF37|nr:hypothetical protein [Chryseobacterium sp. MEBOG07]UKB81633.1 hypothetical protein LF886_11795 [Chryseobacterium sp. MEBOG07]